MRRRSLTGPLLLLLIGGLFLWSNLHPEAPVWHILAQDWPFVLIAWGLIKLVEVLLPGGDERRGGFSGGEVWLIILISRSGHGLRGRPGISAFTSATPVSGIGSESSTTFPSPSPRRRPA